MNDVTCTSVALQIPLLYYATVQWQQTLLSLPPTVRCQQPHPLFYTCFTTATSVCCYIVVVLSCSQLATSYKRCVLSVMKIHIYQLIMWDEIGQGSETWIYACILGLVAQVLTHSNMQLAIRPFQMRVQFPVLPFCQKHVGGRVYVLLYYQLRVTQKFE